jgi:hypothetical protein
MYGLNQVRKELAEKFHWYCIADLDEFHFFNGLKISTVVRHAEQHGYQAIGGRLVDRIAANGTFPEIRGSLDRCFPLGSDLTRSTGACHSKIALAKSHVEIAPGHHDAQAKIAWGSVETHHFKWHRGIHEIIKIRYKNYLRQGMPWAEKEYPRQLKMIEEGVNLTDPKLNLHKAHKLGV